MGMAGTEVAKEAADMILTNDSLDRNCCGGGTYCLPESQKAIGFILPVNGGESLTILVGVLLGCLSYLLWVNMVSSVA